MRNKKELIGLVCPCGCAVSFRLKYFGLFHWWRYTKLRYYWRLFWTKLRYSKVIANGTTFWVDSTMRRVYNCFPGPNMTRDEHDHWFIKDKNEKNK